MLFNSPVLCMLTHFWAPPCQVCKSTVHRCVQDCNLLQLKAQLLQSKILSFKHTSPRACRVLCLLCRAHSERFPLTAYMPLWLVLLQSTSCSFEVHLSCVVELVLMLLASRVCSSPKYLHHLATSCYKQGFKLPFLLKVATIIASFTIANNWETVTVS